MRRIELDAIWRHGNEPPRVVTIVGFEHVIHDGPTWRVMELCAIAVPMKGGIPFSAPASEFEVKDKAYREP